MQNQDQLQENPLHIHIDVLADIRKHYTKNEYSYIKKLISCMNKNNTIVVDNVPIDSDDLHILLGIGKRSASILIKKLMSDEMMEITTKRVDAKFVNTMVMNNNLAFKDNYSGSIVFKDISKGLEPIDLKTLPKLKLRKFKR